MRTRLDEIVDSVWHGDAMPESHFNAWPECRLAAKTIAERAYRLGADDTVKSIVCSGNQFSIDRHVQPAPAAEEKPSPYDEMIGTSLREYEAMLNRHRRDGCPCPNPLHRDRRHGQRRKTSPWMLMGSRVYGGIEVPSTSCYYATSKDGPFYLDRRSGKDRRKP